MSVMGLAERPGRERARALAGLFAFLVFASIATANHEMWRDEHHAWLLARDASSPAEVFRNLRWDMTPGVWHLVLWVVTRFTHDPSSMQILNLAFAGAAAWLVLRHSPFGFGQKLLLVFGYYLGYEYAAISRVYALGVLFIFAICTLWERRKDARFALVVGVLLALLANTPSLYGVIAAGFFLLLLAGDLRVGREGRGPTLVALVIGGTGAIGALLQTLPSGDNPFAVGKATAALELARVERVIQFLASLVVPIPDASLDSWWNSNIVSGRHVAVDATLAAAGLAAAVWLLRRNRALLASWLVAVCGVMYAAYQGGFVGMRHGGYVVILLIAALWVAWSEPGVVRLQRQQVALALLLAVSSAGCVTAWFRELATPFSAAETTANWLRDNELDRVPIAGADDFAVASLASLLDLDRIYYPQRGEWGTFVSWDPKRRLNTTLGDATADVAAKVAASGEPMLFVLTRPPTRPRPEGASVIREATVAPGVRARLLAAFTDSVVEDERMFVYEIAPVEMARR